MCQHEVFVATIGGARLEDTGGFMVEITVNCSQCGLPLQFLGLEPGLDAQGTMISLDGLEARIAIVPNGSRPNSGKRMTFGVTRSQ